MLEGQGEHRTLARIRGKSTPTRLALAWTRNSDPRQFLAAEPTTTVSSPDARLVPHAFRALMRT
jgi:hypothetical protein